MVTSHQGRPAQPAPRPSARSLRPGAFPPALRAAAWGLAALVFAGMPWPAGAQASCRFVLGFADLRHLIGAEVVGDCLEPERFNLINGNAEQRTTGGLLVWRKADNLTAFTDGYRTWLLGPGGLHQRLNTDPPFEWERAPAAAPPPAPAPGPAPMVGDPAARPAVEAVLRDAAARLGVPREQLVVERVEEREWPDTSLGCPQPGFLYAQVITPGYLIIVSGAGQRLEYHTNASGGQLVLCP
jgi:hypothetical protein